ncbi:hypothetical protein Hanom_Chr12g01080471 [Helianthus anomalus]
MEADQVVGEVEGEKVCSVDPLGNSSLPAHDNPGVFPMHVEEGNNNLSLVNVAFEAQAFNPPPYIPSRPSFQDQWANLVGRPSPRPRKRPRSGE